MPRLFLIATVSALVLTGPCWAGPYTLALTPGSSIQGNPGDTIGWGYSITNTSSDFLLAETLDAGSFPSGFTPLNIFDFPEIAPNSTVTLDYSAVVTGTCSSPPCGIYQVTLGPSVPPGTVVNGFFDVFVELFDGDPFAGGTDLGNGADLMASYSASSAPLASGTPEPATLGELGLGIALILWRNRMLRSRTGTCGIIYLKQTVKNKDEEYRFPNGIGE
jgi:hypothetical protein